jgi:hypothetical protein
VVVHNQCIRWNHGVKGVPRDYRDEHACNE